MGDPGVLLFPSLVIKQFEWGGGDFLIPFFNSHKIATKLVCKFKDQMKIVGLNLLLHQTKDYLILIWFHLIPIKSL